MNDPIIKSKIVSQVQYYLNALANGVYDNIITKLFKVSGWPQQYYYLAIPTSSIIALLLIQIIRNHKSNLEQNNLPKPPSPSSKLPVIGHLHLLARNANIPPHQYFAKLASDLGPVYILNLGETKMLVINNYEAAYESLIKRGTDFAGRFLTDPWQILTEGGKNIAFAEYGNDHRAMRRVASKILTPGIINNQYDTRFDIELNRLIAYLKSKPCLNVIPLYQRYTANMIFSKALGFTFEQLDDPELVRILDLMNALFREMAVGGLDEFLPKTGWFWGSFVVRKTVDLMAYKKYQLMHKVSNEFHNGFLLEKLVALKTKLLSQEEKSDVQTNEPLCYAEELLLNGLHTHRVNDDGKDYNIIESEDSTYLPLARIKMMCADLLLAGVDSTAGTLVWITILLVNHPHIQHRGYEEISRLVQTNNRPINQSDIASMPYIKSIVKETLRLKPIAPLGLPRCTTKDTQVSGFHVDKNTQVVYNMASIHMSMYTNDHKLFRPERWLTAVDPAEGAKKMTPNIPDGILSFGLGRRQCPGMHLAVQELYLATARLVEQFEIKSADGDKPVMDLTEDCGLTILPKLGANVRFVPRG